MKRPTLPVLLSSGYSRHEAKGAFGGPEGAAGFVQKPYGLERLRQALKQACDGSAASEHSADQPSGS